MTLAHEANRYLDGKAPWKAIKTDRQAAANSLYTAIGAISALKTMFSPFLPVQRAEIAYLSRLCRNGGRCQVGNPHPATGAETGGAAGAV